jgi:hypothetical protein
LLPLLAITNPADGLEVFFCEETIVVDVEGRTLKGLQRIC